MTNVLTTQDRLYICMLNVNVAYTLIHCVNLFMQPLQIAFNQVLIIKTQPTVDMYATFL